MATKLHSKAQYHRRKVASGRGTDADRAWLAEYEGADPRRRARVIGQVTSEATGQAPMHEPPYQPPPLAPAPASPPPTGTAPHASDPDGWRSIDFGAPPSDAAPGHDPGGSCTIRDCPECRKAKGALRCGTTGGLVYEPMDMDSAEMLAGFLLAVTGLLCRAVRPDHASVQPTKEDKTRVAKGLVKVQHRRAGWIGAFDDLLLLFGGVAMYGKRALTDDGTLPKRLPAAGVNAEARREAMAREEETRRDPS